MTRTTGIVAAVACCLALGGSASYAGVLSGHPDAYGGWTGTVAFNNTLGLSGTVDYAVFTAAQFSANFGGYVPGDAVVYTYQIFNDDEPGPIPPASLAISSLTVDDVLPASAIGTFNIELPATPIGDTNATAAAIISGDAEWTFGTEIQPGDSSWGLVYSSPNLPETTIGLVIDGGTPAFVLEIPAPSDIPIPEPAAWILLSFGVMVVARPTRQS